MHLLAAYLLANADLWFLGLFRERGDVGVYGAMAKLVVLVGLVLPSMNLVLPPRLAALHAAGKNREAEELMRRSSTLGAWAALTVVLVLALSGRFLIGRAFGPDFLVGYGPLLILAFGRFFDVSCGSPGWLLQVTGHQRAVMRVTLTTVLLNLVLNGIGVHYFGMTGVALATTAAVLWQNLAMMALSRRLLGIRTQLYLDPRRVRGRASVSAGTIEEGVR